MVIFFTFLVNYCYICGNSFQGIFTFDGLTTGMDTDIFDREKMGLTQGDLFGWYSAGVPQQTQPYDDFSVPGVCTG